MSTINIHEYPSDPTLLPAYRITVMQAALEGKEVECYNRYNPSWTRIISEPIWDWNANQYRITPPAIAPGHNPKKLTVDQIGEGYRTLSVEEADYLQSLRGDAPVSGLEYFSNYRKVWNQEAVGDSQVMTYRTTNPPGFYLPKPPKPPETIMEWLLTLPKEYRVLAIRNMSETTKDVRQLDLPSAISSAFVWSGSPEGHEFWESVRNSLKQGIPLPPIPVVSAPKKLVPWTLETMVWPDCVRDKNFPTHVYGVQLANSDGLSLGVRPEGCAIHTTTWQSLYDECEYSVDHGKTWLPCGTWEEAKKS